MSEILSCGDNSCMFRFAVPQGGMGTNGGCRCFEVSTREELQGLRRKVAHAINYARTEQAGFKLGADLTWTKVTAELLRSKNLREATDAIMALRPKANAGTK